MIGKSETLNSRTGFTFPSLTVDTVTPARSPAFDVSLLTPCVGFIAVTLVHPVAEQLINALIYLAERLFRDDVAVKISKATQATVQATKKTIRLNRYIACDVIPDAFHEADHFCP